MSAARLLSTLGLFATWELAARLADSRLLPPASVVIARLAHETANGALLRNLGATLARVAGAFALSMILGATLGLAMGRSRRLDAVLDSWVGALLNMPALVLIVLIYVWFGLSDIAAVIAVAVNKLPTTAITLREGARALDPRLAEMAASFRIGRLATLRHVVLPQLQPYLFAAARSGLALVWKIVLVAELLGRSNGVGFEIQIYFQLFDVAGMLAYTLALLMVVQGIEWAVLQPLERYATGWRR